MTPFRRLLYYCNRYRGAFLLGVLCISGSAVFTLMKPVIVGRAVDRLASAHSSSDLLLYGLEYIGATMGAALLIFLQRWIIVGHASSRIDYDVRNDFYGHLQTLPLSYYQEQRTGDLMARATDDVSAIHTLYAAAASYSASPLMMIGGALVMMRRIDPVMALLPFVVFPLVLALIYWYGRKVQGRFRAIQDHYGRISARLHESLAGVRLVRAFNQEAREMETFRRMNREYVARTGSLFRLIALFHPMLGMLIGLMWVGVFFIGSRKMIAGSLSIGEFVAFQMFLGRLIAPLLSLGWAINFFQRGMASLARLNEVWAVRPEAHPGEAAAHETIRGEIEIRGLSFTYAGGEGSALRDIDLLVRPGETIGIVGRTGSGKSTLLALIARLFEPPGGTIFIDHRPVEATSLRQLRNWIGMVPQETFLFGETIAENIRFGEPDASEDAVHLAATLAGLSRDLAVFPKGLETVIGERGITLSGGQKQRTAIARALVREPRILLLDDALSAVDTETEEEILRSLREVRKDRTVFIVSHRVSSVKDADLIVVLDEGRIVERGTHASLLGQGGYYANLHRMQTLAKQLEGIA